MKRYLSINIFTLSIACLIVFSTSCSRSQKTNSETCETTSTIPQSSNMNNVIHEFEDNSDSFDVDWEIFYTSILREHGGVEDFRSDNLIKLLNHEHPSLRTYSALLLAYRNERSSIPRLLDALNDEIPLVRINVAEALLKMDNKEGIQVLQNFCEKAYNELEHGDFRNTHDMLFAAKVLADAGEISAVPYLKKLITWKSSWGVRLTAVRSLAKLYEKQPSVLDDISSRLEDENPQIRREVSEILQRIETKSSTVPKQN